MMRVEENFGGHQLPIEILEIIFNYLDGTTLANFGQTCKELWSTVNSPGKSLMKVWNKICFEEIPMDYRLDILSAIYPKYWLNYEAVKWNIVFKTWKQWRRIDKLHCHTSILDDNAYNITCILVSGPWILTGSRNQGSLVAFNYLTKCKQVLYLGAGVIDMCLMCNTTSIVIDQQNDILPGIAHDEIMLYLETHVDAIINLHSGYTKVYPRSTNLYQTRMFENYIVKVINRGGDSYIMIENFCSPTKERKINNCFLRILDVWDNKIVCLDLEAVLRIYDFDLNIISDHEANGKYLEHMNKIEKVLSWHGNVTLFTRYLSSCLHELRISVSGRTKIYLPFKDLSVSICCSMYYCGILFIGTDIGTIYTFQVERDNDLLELDITDYKCCFDLGSEEIVAMSVVGCKRKPVILACTQYKVIQLNFYN